MSHISASTARLRAEGGFTLIELLVVVLIVGILAGIAIPAFIGQRQKGQDAAAKSMSRHAAVAAESFAVDNSGTYTSMTIGTLQGIEPSLNDGGPVRTVAALVGTVGTNSFTVTTQSKSGKYFSVTRNNSTGVTYRCSSASAPTAACTASDW